MVSSVGSSRGYLRPFARSPPILLIVLILICGISVFNYWNLSSQYSDVVKEISDLQEHIRIITNKHESAEKLVEALHEKLRNSEDLIGKLKVNLVERSSSLNEAKKQIDFKNDEILRLGNNLKQAEDVTKLRNEAKETLQHELELLKKENSVLVEKNFVLQNTLGELKVKMSSVMGAQRFKVPDIVKLDPSKTAAQTDVPVSLIKESNKTEDAGIAEIDAVTEKDEENRGNEEDNATEANSLVNNPNFEYQIQGGEAVQSAIDAKVVAKNPIAELLKAKSESLKNASPRILLRGRTTTSADLKKMASSAEPLLKELDRPRQFHPEIILGA